MILNLGQIYEKLEEARTPLDSQPISYADLGPLSVDIYCAYINRLQD